MTETSRLRLPFLSGAQAQKHVTVNEALLALDALVASSVLDKDLTTPPGSPADGDAYIVAATATGAWVGWEGSIAQAVDGGWRRHLPIEGLSTWVADEEKIYVYEDSAWRITPRAVDVPFTPAGSIAATNVQAALEELDAEKAAASHTHSSSAITDFTEAAQDAVGAMVADTATVDVTYADATPALTFDVKDNAITDAKLRDSAAVSVVGRAANSGGDPADIAASANDTVLRRTGDALSFGGLTVGMAANDLWTYAKLQNVSATDRLLGRSSSGAGDIEEIACTAAGRALIDDADAAAQRNTLATGWGLILPQTRALINAMTVEPRRARTFLIDDTITALVDAGLWAKLDALWMFAAHDGQAGRLNWKTPGTWTMTAVNSPVFTADEGYAGDGASARLEPGVAWSGLTQFQLDSAHIGYRISGGTDASSNASAIGSVTGSTSTRSRPRDSGAGGNFAANINTTTVSAFGTSHGTIMGTFLATRRGATELEGYVNGVSLGTDNDTSGAVSTAMIATHYHNTIYANFELQFVHLGAGLSDTEAGDLHTILNAYIGGL